MRGGGGVVSGGYAGGGVFGRYEVHELQQKSRQELIQRLEQESTIVKTSASTTGAEEAALQQAAMQQRQRALDGLRRAPVSGRLVIHLRPGRKGFEGSPDDIDRSARGERAPDGVPRRGSLVRLWHRPRVSSTGTREGARRIGNYSGEAQPFFKCGCPAGRERGIENVSEDANRIGEKVRGRPTKGLDKSRKDSIHGCRLACAAQWNHGRAGRDRTRFQQAPGAEGDDAYSLQDTIQRRCWSTHRRGRWNVAPRPRFAQRTLERDRFSGR